MPPLPRTMIVAAAATLLAPSIVVPALAWDKDGHEAIGMTTMSALGSEATAAVKHLMGGRDAADIAAWAHKVNKKFPWTNQLHFQSQSRMRCGGSGGKAVGGDKKGEDQPELTCADNKCLVKAMKYFYGRLVHRDLASIEWPGGMNLTDADCVKYLVNLIGDLHQPMHLGLAADSSGRNDTVRTRDSKQTTLYDMWDSGLSQDMIRRQPGVWWSGWTRVQRVSVEYKQEGDAWAKSGVVNFDRWAEESLKFLCDNIYNDPSTGKQLFDGTPNGPIVEISDELHERWTRAMLSRMLTAGSRVAIVLNDVLRHRENEEALHAGSGVKGLEGEPDSNVLVDGKAHGRLSDAAHAGPHAVTGLNALIINFGIFSVVAIVFMQLMISWQGLGAVHKANKGKMQEGGKAT